MFSDKWLNKEQNAQIADALINALTTEYGFYIYKLRRLKRALQPAALQVRAVDGRRLSGLQPTAGYDRPRRQTQVHITGKNDCI